MSARWTDETEELVARTIAAVDRYRYDDVDEVWRSYREAARAALQVSADAGLLLPPGGETREEWTVGHPRDEGGFMTWTAPLLRRELAEGEIAFRVRKGYDIPGTVLRREVQFGPWAAISTEEDTA